MSRETVEVEKVVETVVAVTCNRCGRRVSWSADASFPQDGDFTHFDVSGGWNSTFPPDCTELEFDLCGACLRELVATFTVPVTAWDVMTGQKVTL